MSKAAVESAQRLSDKPGWVLVTLEGRHGRVFVPDGSRFSERPPLLPNDEGRVS